jgi:adenylate cyclase
VTPESGPAGQEATFAFIDLAGFTALTETHGDQDAIAWLDRFAAVVAATLESPEQLVKTIGDAVMLRFADPGAGVAAVTATFRACTPRSGMPLPRAGMHHGAAVPRGDDWFGTTVNLAARITALARPGELLATQPIAEAARAGGVVVIDRGPHPIRNLGEPVELYELHPDPHRGAQVVDPVCRMQVDPHLAAGHLHHHQTDFWFCSLSCVAAFAQDPDRYVAD